MRDIRGSAALACALTGVLLVLGAGCAVVPPAPPVPAPPGIAKTPETPPAPPAPTPKAVTAPPPAPVRLDPVDWAALPGWYSDRIDEAWPALLQSCRALTARKAEARWLTICRAADALAPAARTDPAQVRSFFERHFVAHQLVAVDAEGNANTAGLITGYYEPLLRGSRTRDQRYRYPLYAVPDDLVVVDLAELYPPLKGQRVRGRLNGRRLLPYFSRAEIDRGVTSLKGRELLWVDDRLDAFFLEIQGSGRVQLPDGSIVRIGYADQNGHPYRAIGRVLVDRGELTLEEVSMQSIRRWAEANPEKVDELLHANPSRVFFRELPAQKPAAGAVRGPAASGPPGALGVPLTPMRSIAVDPRAVMLGAPVWLATVNPLDGTPIERLTFAQDTGGAIIGTVRADLFWGFGSAAGEAAGRMREYGRMWVLLPRP